MGCCAKGAEETIVDLNRNKVANSDDSRNLPKSFDVSVFERKRG